MLNLCKVVSKLLSGLIIAPLVVSGVGYFQISAMEQQYDAETSLNNILGNMNYYTKRDFLNVLHTAMDIASDSVEPLELNSIPFYDRLKVYVTGKDDRYLPLYTLYKTDIKTVSGIVDRILKDETPMDTRIVLTNPDTLFYLDNNQEARYPYSEPDTPYHVPSSFNNVCYICNYPLSPDPCIVYNDPSRRLITLCCHHTFHSKCYRPWLLAKKTNKCPNCNKDNALDCVVHLSYDVQLRQHR